MQNTYEVWNTKCDEITYENLSVFWSHLKGFHNLIYAKLTSKFFPKLPLNTLYSYDMPQIDTFSPFCLYMTTGALFRILLLTRRYVFACSVGKYVYIFSINN